jgi:hypothetical protein
MDSRHGSSSTYNVLHNSTVDNDLGDAQQNDFIDEYDDEEPLEYASHKKQHHQQQKKEVLESFNFGDMESIMWKKVNFINYFIL